MFPCLHGVTRGLLLPHLSSMKHGLHRYASPITLFTRSRHDQLISDGFRRENISYRVTLASQAI